MSDSSQQPPMLDLQVVMGGKEITVRTLPMEVPERVRVRYLPVVSYPDFSVALQDEVEQVALFTDRPRAWVETLHPASHAEIMVLGHDLNLSFFEQWVSRRRQTLRVADPQAEARALEVTERVVRELLAPRVDELMASLQRQATASVSPDSSPDSASSPATPASS